MFTKKFVTKEQYLNFLYVNNTKSMNKIYETISNKQFIKEDEFTEERTIIKEQFLKRIENGMTHDEYKSWIKILKRISNELFPIVIDDLVKIFNSSDKELIDLTINEPSLNNYNFVNSCDLKTNEHLDINKIKPYHSIHVLEEILTSTRSFIIKYALSSTSENGDSSKACIKILNDLKKTDSFYYQTLKEMFVSKFSYLENSMFKDIYQFMLLTLRTEFKKLVSNKCSECSYDEKYTNVISNKIRIYH